MLAYAFQVLKQDSYAAVAEEEFQGAENLLAAILAKGITNQIKRGLGREYISCIDALSTPVGKINLSESMKNIVFLQKKLICEFDEFSKNTYTNQIIKTSIILLIKSDTVKKEQKKTLKNILLYFNGVDILNQHKIQWSNIIYTRNNATYKMLIYICYLILNALIHTEHEGTKKFPQFKDEYLHKLFERFVLEYYKKHYPEYNSSASYIDWNVDDKYIELLPAMKSDITLKYANKILIIDTKYYNKILHTNSMFDNKTIHSANLYQIFSYVKNCDKFHTGNVSGVLLYAKTDEQITPDNSYQMDKNRISVKTLCLDCYFSEIQTQLDAIADEWIASSNSYR